jgi:imidazoleglycerol-phosphate dehydratase
MRMSEIKRKTNETDISLKLNLDGSGKYDIESGIPFLNHMLENFTKHSGFDLELKAKGDIEVDFHHTIEDTGIVLGEAIKKALGDKKGIVRFADSTIPLDEALNRVTIDLSGRPFLNFNVNFERSDDGNNINPYLFEEFFKGLVSSSQMTLHIDMIRGNNSHHIIESIFKAFAKSLKKAVEIDSDEIPSTKGKI